MALTKVSTDGVKDDAITSGKIPANAVGASELADNAVDTNAIANNAVTAGKTSGVQTTINNNADNRVITGSGTANTLNGESNVVIDANGKLGIGIASPNQELHVKGSGTVAAFEGTGGSSFIGIVDSDDSTQAFIGVDGGNMKFQTSGSSYSDKLVIDTSGKVIVKTNGLKLENATATNSRTFSITNAAGTTGWSFGNGVIASAHQFVIYDNSAGAGRMLIDSNGIARFNNGIQLGNGLTNSTAHQLDDYEEGTFTSTVYWSANNTTGGYTNTSTETGRYTKVGRIVQVQIKVNPYSYNSGSNCWITGASLPFTVAADSVGTMAAYSGRGNYGGSLNPNDYDRVYALFQASINQIRVYVTGNDSGAGFWGHYSGTVSAYAQIGGVYEH